MRRRLVGGIYIVQAAKDGVTEYWAAATTGSKVQLKSTSVSLLMIRAIVDNRLRHVWTILIGMSVLAVTVEVVTIHDPRPHAVTQRRPRIRL
jgi:hypothetical protein